MTLQDNLPSIKIKVPNLKGGGAVLSEDDCFMFNQLFLHRQMESLRIHELYQYAKENRNKNSISNRLKRFRTVGLIKAQFEPIEPLKPTGLMYYHYQLTKRGLDVLVELQLISEEESELYLSQTSRIGIPSPHTKATSKLANGVFLECERNPHIPSSEVLHGRGSIHRLFGTTFKSKGGIVPDWVFERHNQMICLETDTGTERGNEIKSKYKRYVDIAKKLQADGKVLTVIFSLVEKESLEKEKRAVSIKEHLPLFHEWPKNLNFYSLSISRVPSLVGRILTYHEPTSRLEQNVFIDEWVNKIFVHSTDRQPFLKFPLNDYYIPGRDKRMDVEAVISMPLGNKDLLFGVLYAEEGSIRSHQLIRTNLKRHEDINSSLINKKLKSFPLHLLVCYAEEERIVGNLHGIKPTTPLVETDFVTWEQWDGQKLPKMYVTKKAYRKELGEMK